jgi:predicted SprT family Zn-dependent metalloprotease
MELTIHRLGLSSDRRTNRWAITCQCGKVNEPTTTIRASQRFCCEKCGTEIYADYNAEPPTAKVVGGEQP